MERKCPDNFRTQMTYINSFKTINYLVELNGMKDISDETIESRLNYLKSLPYDILSLEYTELIADFKKNGEIEVYPESAEVRYVEKEKRAKCFYQVLEKGDVGEFYGYSEEFEGFNFFNIYRKPIWMIQDVPKRNVVRRTV